MSWSAKHEEYLWVDRYLDESLSLRVAWRSKPHTPRLQTPPSSYQGRRRSVGWVVARLTYPSRHLRHRIK